MAWRWRKGDNRSQESLWASMGRLRWCTPRWAMHSGCCALPAQRGVLKHMKYIEWLSDTLAAPSPIGMSVFCRVTRLFFYKTIKLKRQNTGEFILLFNLTAWKKQKNKQNPQWLLHPIPPPYVPPLFQRLCTGKTKKECGYLPWGLAEPLAVTTVGTAVYTDTLPGAEHSASAPALCK